VPGNLDKLLTLNLVVLGWRVVALVQAFFDTRFELRPARLGVAGLAIVLIVTLLPHAGGAYLGGLARSTFAQIFGGGVLSARSDREAGAGPGPNDRLSVLLVGVDSGAGRDHALTDSVIVVSVDPIGKAVSMVSLPRDLVNVPLGNGQTFGPKLNSLLSFANDHPKDFPAGGMRTLENAVGALLGIRIDYYATVDLNGFIKMVDAVGGVDVNVRQALDDPKYRGFGVKLGWSISTGQHHLDGIDALAYARIRRSVGQTDFTRQARQQEILLALRTKVIKGGALFSLPSLLDAVGQTVSTDLPAERLPDLAVLANEIPSKRIVRVVILFPLVHPARPGESKYGAVQIPNMASITAMAEALFPPVGTTPTGWKPGQSPSSLAPSTSPSP
jgi:LCP family protein required for cell wall assembly